jgi:hypothetical protein
METNDIFTLNHLNIGDLVEHRTNKGQITHFYVIGLSDLMLIEQNIVKALRTYFPIKISAEILRFFNFEELGKDVFVFEGIGNNIFVKKIDDSDYINYIEVSKRDSEYNVYFYCNGKIVDLPNNKVNYIHNLQSWTKLIYNKELTIK